MKIHIQRNTFVPAFALVAGFAAQKNTRAVLQCVKIVADPSKVVLMATDGETGARAEITFENPLNIARTGQALASAKILNRIFNETTDDEILLELNDTRLTVKGEKFRYALDTIAEVDSFPNVASFDENSFGFKIAGADLRRMIRHTNFVSDALNVHFNLEGVKFTFYRDSALAVATDGRRLALQRVAATTVGELPENFQEVNALFSLRALKQIHDASKTAEEVVFAVKGETAQLKVGNVVVHATLKSGRFPDWERIVPKSETFKEIVFIAGDLCRAVRQAEIVASDDKPGIAFNLEEGRVLISVVGESKGDSVVELPIKYDGDALKLTFDARYLTDFLNALAPEEVVHFQFSPSEYRTLFETNDSYRYVLMQIA